MVNGSSLLTVSAGGGWVKFGSCCCSMEVDVLMEMNKEGVSNNSETKGVKTSVSKSDGDRTTVGETSISMVLPGKIASVGISVERDSKSSRDGVGIAMNT